MENKYLNSALKEYYFRDFKENVLKEKNSFWKIPLDIRPFLMDINKRERIQSIYSLFPKKGSDFGYLELVYFEEVKLQLEINVLPYFQHRQFPPRDNKNINLKSRLGCRNNPDYFRINTISFTFYDLNKDKHLAFWNNLANKLTAIK